MAIWTQTPAEYEHARQIILDATDFWGKRIRVHLTSGNTIDGWLVGTNSGTDVGQNMTAGRGPVVTRMYGEIQLLTETGQVIVLEAVGIKEFEAASP
jgi:hypothetical protein